jgi:hypothetical protein
MCFCNREPKSKGARNMISHYITTTAVPFDRIVLSLSALKTLAPVQVKLILTRPFESAVAGSFSPFVADTTAFGTISLVVPSITLKVMDRADFRNGQ